MSMDLKKKKCCHIQCQVCGMIYTAQRNIPFEEMYVKANCPNCGIVTGLNLGDNEDDVYVYMNENIDPRYY